MATATATSPPPRRALTQRERGRRILQCWTTPDLYAAIAQAARHQRCTVSSFIRRAVICYAERAAIPPELGETIAALALAQPGLSIDRAQGSSRPLLREEV